MLFSPPGVPAEDAAAARSSMSRTTARRGFPRRASGPVVALLLGIPILVSVVTVVGKRYVPIGDEASMLFRTEQVGTGETPLVGVYSTRGWAHPGPILYYLLAVPYHLWGHGPALFVAAGVINLASLFLLCYLAWRRRRWLGLAVYGGITAMLLHGLRPDILIQIWNPYVPLLLYLAFLLSLWSVAERDYAVLPVAAALASVIVQMHVAYLPLVVAGSVGVALWLRLTRSADATAPRLRSAYGWVTVAVVAVLWLPPLLDVMFGGQNLLHVLKYFVTGHAVTVGPSTGLGLLSGHVSLTGPWTGGHERVIFADVQPETLWPLAVLIALLVVLAAALYRRQRRAAGLPLLALAELAAAGAAAGKIEEPVLSYMVVWMLPLAAFCWGAVAVSAMDLVRSHRWSSRSRVPAAVIAGTLVLAVIETIRTASVASNPPLARQQYAEPVASIVSQLWPKLNPGDKVRVEGVGDPFNEAWVGVLYALSQRGNHFYTSDGAAGQKWGLDHRWTGQAVDYTLTVAVTDPNSRDDPIRACNLDRGHRQLAVWDQLSGPERGEFRKLQIKDYEAKGGLPLSRRARYESLHARAYRLSVFKGGSVCGS